MKLYLFKLLLFLFFFVLLGLLREYVFTNLNNVIYFKYYKNTTKPIPFGFAWFTKFSYSYLYYLKYPLTIIFVLVYYFSNVFFLRQFEVDSFYIKIITLSYIAVFLISALLMTYAYFVHKNLNDNEYLLSRGLMGLAQSPLIGFFLFTVYLWDRNKLQRYEKRNSGF